MTGRKAKCQSRDRCWFHVEQGVTKERAGADLYLHVLLQNSCPKFSPYSQGNYIIYHIVCV